MAFAFRLCYLFLRWSSQSEYYTQIA